MRVKMANTNPPDLCNLLDIGLTGYETRKKPTQGNDQRQAVAPQRVTQVNTVDITRQGMQLYKVTQEVLDAKPSTPCREFNKGNCSYQADHTASGYRRQHVCNWCLPNAVEAHLHSEFECQKRKRSEERRATKNAKPAAQ